MCNFGVIISPKLLLTTEEEQNGTADRIVEFTGFLILPNCSLQVQRTNVCALLISFLLLFFTSEVDGGYNNVCKF